MSASGDDVRSPLVQTELSAQSLFRYGDLKTLMIYDDNRQGLQGKASQALGDLLDSSESEACGYLVGGGLMANRG